MTTPPPKDQLIRQLKAAVQNRIDEAQRAIANAQTSANEETKSSVGDKYETGRAMGQLSIEMYSRQLQAALHDMGVLNGLSAEKTSDHIALGSLAKTSLGWLYFAIGIGKIQVGNQDVMVLSPASPLGEQLIQQTPNAEILFRNSKIFVQEVY